MSLFEMRVSRGSVEEVRGVVLWIMAGLLREQTGSLR